MMLKTIITQLFFAIVATCGITTTTAQDKPWRAGILKEEAIYESAPFPECHASTIAETPKGLIVSFFGGTKEGNPDVCIYTSRLVNGKWTAPQQVADGIQNANLRYPCWNPVLYQVPGGELLLFYKIGPDVPNWKGWMLRSKDNGIIWGKPEKLPDGFYGPIKNKPVLLKTGELFCPSSDEKPGDIWNVHFEVTRDNGKTCKKTGTINDGKTWNIIQPSILTYPDGKLQILCRSQQRTVAQSWSRDNGKTWSAPAKTILPNNNSGTDAVTLKDGRQLIVYNHLLPPDTAKRGKGIRTPLNVAISKDGQKWYAALVLEDSPVSHYSYPSVIQTADGMVHIVYTWRRLKIKHVVVDPAKLVVKELVDSEWPG